jgi:hypothetical protein
MLRCEAIQIICQRVSDSSFQCPLASPDPLIAILPVPSLSSRSLMRRHSMFCEAVLQGCAASVISSCPRAPRAVRMHVAASSLNTGDVAWFDDTDPDILDGCLASGGSASTQTTLSLLPSDAVPARALGESRSGANQRYADRATPDIDGTRSAFGLVGAIAPLIPPHPVRESFYVDGGIFHNTPILKALSEGATSVIAILLSPIGSAMTVNYSAPSNNRGVAILNYYIDVLDRRIFSGEPDATDSETAPTGRLRELTPQTQSKKPYLRGVLRCCALDSLAEASAAARRYGSQNRMLPVPRAMARPQPLTRSHFSPVSHLGRAARLDWIAARTFCNWHPATSRRHWRTHTPRSSRSKAACVHPKWRCGLVDR